CATCRDYDWFAYW
nr:immunoglobulin heavy chain junction region [Mus musculus]MBK4189343.1 immunoglobulin heavy chain junction region [Mus musculus]